MRPTWMAGWFEGLIVGWLFGLSLGCLLTLGYIKSHPHLF